MARWLGAVWIVAFGASALAASGTPPPSKPAKPPAAPEAPAPPAARPWLGVFLGDATDGGVQIVAVLPDSPAAKSGLAAGELLIAIDGREIADRDEFQSTIDALKPGQTISLTTLRGGTKRVRAITLGSGGRVWLPQVIAPEPLELEFDSLENRLGIEVRAIPKELAAHYGASAEPGALLVVRIEPESLGAKAGLGVGDVISRASGRPVADEDALLSSLNAAKPGGDWTLEGAHDRKTASWKIPAASRRERAAAAEREARIRSIEATIDSLRKEIEGLESELRALREAPSRTAPPR